MALNKKKRSKNLRILVLIFENLRIYDSISVPHHLQNLSLVDSLLPHKEHDLELDGVTFEGVPILLPSILPPQFGQK